MADEEERVEPRRSARLALTELSFNETNDETPNKNVSADEMVIVQRGPRKKPITWSPVEQDKFSTKGSSREKIPLETYQKRPSLNSKLRRRLILSPTKDSGQLGNIIARKLKALPRFMEEFNDKTREV